MGASAMDAAQAILTAFDTSMSKHWREEDRRWRAEDRSWRAEDLEFREEERSLWLEEKVQREREIRWREEDMEQRNMENARYLWLRFVEKNRRDVEEKSEQLKAISGLAALFAGFAVVTLTQFNFQYSDVKLGFVIAYGVLTAFVVGLNTIAMVLCALILGSILKNGKGYVDEAAEEDFMGACKVFVDEFQEGDRPPAPRRTFERFWDARCEDDWRWAFRSFTWGVMAFICSLIPIGFIKFSYSPLTSWLFASIVMVSLIAWGYVQYSWGTYLTKRKHVHSSRARNNMLGLPFDWHATPEVFENAHDS